MRMMTPCDAKGGRLYLVFMTEDDDGDASIFKQWGGRIGCRRMSEQAPLTFSKPRARFTLLWTLRVGRRMHT